MKNHWKPWSKQDDERLRELMDKNAKPSRCARELGRSLGAIYARQAKLRTEVVEVKPKRKSFWDFLLG